MNAAESRQLTWVFAGLVAARVALPLVLVDPAWEYHRDELLYFAMGDHLAWRMQFPPLVPLVAKVSTLVFGDAVLSARVPAALAGGALCAAVLWFVRRLGGGLAAMLLAWIALVAAPVFLRPSVLFQPVVFDQLWCTLSVMALLLAAHDREPRWWLLVGTAFGLGLLTKFSVLLYGAVAAVLGLLHPALRAQLRTRWPWIGFAIALAMGSVTLLGQVHFDWPFLKSLAALKAGQFEATNPIGTVAGQALMLGAGVVVAMAGVAAALGWSAERTAPLRERARLASWFALGLLALVLWQGGKEYYVAPAYPTLIAVGAVALASAGRWVPWVVGGFATAGAAFLLPMGVPSLPPAEMAAFAARLGTGTTTNRGARLELPQDYADMLGWRAQAEAMAKAYAALTPEEQASVIISGSNYGEAGALARYAPRFGYPYPVARSGDWHAWGLGGRRGDVVLMLEEPDAEEALKQIFTSVEAVDSLGDARSVPEERDLRIYRARGPREPLQQLWERLGAEWN